MGHPESRRNYRLLSGVLFTYFLTWSFSFSLFSIWLNQSVGLEGQATGLVFSVNAIVVLLILPVYGYVQDKLGLRKYLLYVVAILLIACGPFMVYLYGPLLGHDLLLGIVVGAVFIGLTFGAGTGVVESYVERVSRVTGFEFGKARMWGSLGWACATFCAGYLFNINPHINFWLGMASALAFASLILLVHPANNPHQEEVFDQKASTLTVTDALALIRNPKFLALSTYTLGIASIYTVYDQQFPVFFASTFQSQAAGNAIFGYLNSIQVLLEAIGMFLAPPLVNRIGAKNGLLLAGGIMALRMLGSGYADSPAAVGALKLLHAAELPILLVSLFKYISVTFDARLSATVYLVGFAFMTQLGTGLLSVAAGMIYESLGFQTSYRILGMVVAGFVVISYFILTRDTTVLTSEGLDENEENYHDALHPTSNRG